MVQKVSFLVKTGIFYDFSKVKKSRFENPILSCRKGNGSSAIGDVKPGLRASHVVTLIRAEITPERCVAFFHPIPFYHKIKSEKQKLRRKWVDFFKIGTCTLGTQWAFGGMLWAFHRGRLQQQIHWMISFGGWREMESAFVFFWPGKLIVFWATTL